MKRNSIKFALLLTAAIFIYGCGVQRKKLDTIKTQEMQAKLVLPKEKEADFKQIDAGKTQKDTFSIVDVDGHEMIIMNTIKDENGEMVATQQLEAAVVMARFRNIAERHGQIDIEFQIIVPAEMQDSKWQIRFNPDMFILNDSTRLEPVIITGNEYRKAQLRGYQQYEHFLKSIVNDSTKFINMSALEIFIRRNIPELYAFKTDSTFVSDEEFESAYGISQQEAIYHYTNHLRVKMNNNRKNRKEAMFKRYVKAPIITEGIRLDTVIQMKGGEFLYNYIQTIRTRPKLRKIDVVLSGDIYEQEHHLYSIPRTEPLTFYVSSLSAFVDPKERYLMKVIERKAEANTVCNIDFDKGKYDIDESLGVNRTEIARIKNNLRSLLSNEKFDLDSITISAFASPEGSKSANDLLCSKRAESASRYFSTFTRNLQDSLKREEGMFIEIGDDMSSSGMKKKQTQKTQVRFKSRTGGENWSYLDDLVFVSAKLTDENRESYNKLKEINDPDARETALSREPYFPVLRDELYSKLRVVQFKFFMHRKGMVKDTMHTMELDTVYMNGVQCIRDRDYEGALLRLRDYNDFNTAIAFTALDRNKSAMLILQKLEPTAQVNYMMAILYARDGDDQNAVQCYMRACGQDKSFVNRGNLDPEIAALIRKYNLNKQNDDEFAELYSF